MATEGSQRPHLFPENTSTTAAYTAPSGGGGAKVTVPPRERQQQVSLLRAQFAEVEAVQQQRVAQQQDAGLQVAVGVQVEFESRQGVAFAAESLARDAKGIELMNVRQRDDQIFATVFVPQGQLTHFERLLQDYVDEKKDKIERPRDNQKLVDAIRAVRVATFESLWTDSDEALPADDQDSCRRAVKIVDAGHKPDWEPRWPLA